jgi:mRNA interferase MazF
MRLEGWEVNDSADKRRDVVSYRKLPSRIIYPNEVLLPAGPSGLKVDSIALCYQIRTLDKNRLDRQLGTLTEEHLRHAILQALRFQLEL